MPVQDYMPRNALAIWLELYTAVVCVPVLAGAVPFPLPLLDWPIMYRYAAFVALAAGCFIALVGNLWPRKKSKDRDKQRVRDLDGSVFEQIGLVIATIGLLLIIGALVPVLPMGFFTTCLTGGFTIAFLTQWYFIRRWRTQLRRLAQDGSTTPTQSGNQPRRAWVNWTDNPSGHQAPRESHHFEVWVRNPATWPGRPVERGVPSRG
jgi:hypothetical protein